MKQAFPLVLQMMRMISIRYIIYTLKVFMLSMWLWTYHDSLTGFFFLCSSRMWTSVWSSQTIPCRKWQAMISLERLRLPFLSTNLTCYSFIFLIFEAKYVGILFDMQESKSLKDIPVVIMSSDNIPSRINRWGKLRIFFPNLVHTAAFDFKFINGHCMIQVFSVKWLKMFDQMLGRRSRGVLSETSSKIWFE